jgi:hypothetical protein
MEVVINYLCKEWREVKNAPIFVVAVFLVAFFFGWQAKGLLHQQYVESLEAKGIHLEVRAEACEKDLAEKVRVAQLANGLTCPSVDDNKDITTLSKRAATCRMTAETLRAQLAACTATRNVTLIQMEEAIPPLRRIKTWLEHSTPAQMLALAGCIACSILAVFTIVFGLPFTGGMAGIKRYCVFILSWTVVAGLLYIAFALLLYVRVIPK